MKNELTVNERKALSNYWGMKIRVVNGNIKAKKGDCWGVLCSAEDGKMNAQLILNKNK